MSPTPSVAGRSVCRSLGSTNGGTALPTARQARRADIDAKVKAAFDASGGAYGSPRILDELRDAGEAVSKKTVERSMARQGLVARPGPARRHWLTRQAKKAAAAPDLLGRDFHAAAINVKWSGDLTEIPTDEGKLYLAAVQDLASRRVAGFAIGEHRPATPSWPRRRSGKWPWPSAAAT